MLIRAFRGPRLPTASLQTQCTMPVDNSGQCTLTIIEWGVSMSSNDNATIEKKNSNDKKTSFYGS